jgi:hypothetical protein
MLPIETIRNNPANGVVNGQQVNIPVLVFIVMG